MAPPPMLQGSPVTAPEKAGWRRPLLTLSRVAAAVVVPIAGFFILWATFKFLRDSNANRLAVVAVALVVGVAGIWILYWSMDLLVSNVLPLRFRESVRPAVFVGPALVILGVYLVYPAVNTTILAFKNAKGESFVGLRNFVDIFTKADTLVAIRNSILWVVIVPAVSVIVGLAFATLADKLGHRAEAASKAMIFLPMAISLVGASIVWKFIYSFRSAGFGNQIGLLNGIWTGLGNQPVAWLQTEPWNNLFLMVILIWLQAGFAMVILSAAIKSVPEDLLEAARIDGATEWQVFYRVVLPSISSTVVVVITTITIVVWKVFDIVFVMTGGRFDTAVVAERMVTEFFTYRNDGIGAALAVVLFVAVIPIMVINVRKFRQQEETR
jgi:alpha-glucoside transport system permease protein